MIHTTHALIDLNALQHNLQRVRQLAPASRIMAIIKADAYGHGIVHIAHALTTVDGFGVARLDEAIRLREAGVTQAIILLEGFLDAAELPLICQYRLSVVVHDAAQLEILEHAHLNTSISVWIKVDTGMHRLGFAPGELDNVWNRLNKIPYVADSIRIMTHLARADDYTDSFTLEQVKCFDDAVADIEAERSIANSAAILGWPQTHAEWIRPGLMLYGVSPIPGRVAGQEGLKPVMTLSTKLIATHKLQKGAGVGYGTSWVCPYDMPVGVAAIGYGDGYPRHAEPGTPVLVNGQRVPLIGRVSMDMICVDLSSQPEARVGDSVILWGVGLPVEEVAQHASTIPYELLCGVARRVKAIISPARGAHPQTSLAGLHQPSVSSSVASTPLKDIRGSR